MILILSHILSFITGGAVILIVHCCLILGKNEDKVMESEINKENKK